MKTEQEHSGKQNLDRLLSPQLFKAIGDPNRIAILRRLSDRCTPLTVGQIAEGLPVDVSVVSRHLAILRDADILIARKEGKEVRYSLNSRNLIGTLRAIADAFEACCPDECLISDATKTEPRESGLKTGKDRTLRKTG
jgi:DNA-binding transcriptional ArsR family regulator